MSNYYYVPQQNTFYSVALKDDYQAAGTWPDKGVYITEKEHRALMQGQNAGKVIAPDEKGRPVLTEPEINWQERAETARNKLLNEANTVTADWRVELVLGSITQADKVKLIAWMNYIKQLKAIDLNLVTDESSLNSIKWPVKPI
ncbi:tail fiber assembly protein [Cronobacter sakazakii]